MLNIVIRMWIFYGMLYWFIYWINKLLTKIGIRYNQIVNHPYYPILSSNSHNLEESNRFHSIMNAILIPIVPFIGSPRKLPPKKTLILFAHFGVFNFSGATPKFNIIINTRVRDIRFISMLAKYSHLKNKMSLNILDSKDRSTIDKKIIEQENIGLALDYGTFRTDLGGIIFGMSTYVLRKCIANGYEIVLTYNVITPRCIENYQILIPNDNFQIAIDNIKEKMKYLIFTYPEQYYYWMCTHHKLYSQISVS